MIDNFKVIDSVNLDGITYILCENFNISKFEYVLYRLDGDTYNSLYDFTELISVYKKFRDNESREDEKQKINFIIEALEKQII